MAINFDNQSVRGADNTIDHGASAKENLSQAGDNAKLMLLDKTYAAIKQYAKGAAMRDMENWGYEVEGSAALTALKGVAMFPVGLVRDAFEIATQPLLVVKDLADAAYHGIASLFRD
ncbi:MAG: hypothetical protein ACYTFT_09205 [Planctomycetota bacterium]|jgi:hypothetical protein